MVNEWLSGTKNPVWNLSLNRLLSNRRVVTAFRRATRRGSTLSVFLKPEYLEEDVNRRSFVTSLFGGLAAASVGGAAFAAARKPALASAVPAGDQIDASTRAALDEADADFNQIRVQIGPRRRRRWRRRPIVRRRVIVRRPPRRRRVITRRVIVR
jgi:hypothetical protein